MQRVLAMVFAALLVQGCVGIGHQEFYSQVAPTKFPPTQKTMLFTYPNTDLKDIYHLLFSDFLIIGKSSFNGPYQDPQRAIPFANSIGADVFITSAQFKETRTSYVPLTLPTSQTTYISGYSGAGSFYGTATSYGTTTTMTKTSVDRYDQNGFYLKNVNHVVPLWERVDSQYKRTEPSDLDGTWFNEDYKINIYRSGDQIVAFVAEKPKNTEKASWGAGQLKFLYGINSGVGIYLSGNKTPVPARFQLNKFGNLEATFIGFNETYSFARQLH